MSPYLTTKEVAEYLRCSVQTIYNRRWKGDKMLPAVKEGRRVLYRRSDVEAYERSLRPT